MRTIIPFVCLALLGIALIPFMIIKLVPSQTMPSISIYFSIPNNSARIIEMEATSKLEGALGRVKGVKSIRSVSSNGYASLQLQFDKYTDIEMARFEASTIIRQVWPKLPEGTTYPYISTQRSDDKANVPFMSYVINAPETPFYIGKYTEEVIVPALGQIEGIYRVTVTGAMPMEWHLEYNIEQLKAANVTPNDIRKAIDNLLSEDSYGTVSWETPTGEKQVIRLTLKGEGINKELDPRRIQVVNANGEIFGLERLAKVERKEATPTNYFRINGLNSVYLLITAEENANQLELSKQVESKINMLSKHFPTGYHLALNNDSTKKLRESLHTIYWRSALTIIILLLFVLLITRSMSYLLITTLSIGLNLCIAFVFYYLLKIEIQLYSLAGITLSLSLMIDNTIVMINHRMHHRDLRVFLALLAATLTTVSSLSVIFFLDESVRLNLEAFAIVIIINLMVSLAIALMLVPALMKLLQLESQTQIRSFAIRKQMVHASWWYSKCIIFMMRWRKSIVLLLIIIFGFPFFMIPVKLEGNNTLAHHYNKFMNEYPFISEKFLPALSKWGGGTLNLFVQSVISGTYNNNTPGEKYIYIRGALPSGSTLEQMNALAIDLETFISKSKGIQRFETSVSSAQEMGIYIVFQKEFETTHVPIEFKQLLFDKASSLGSGNWSVSSNSYAPRETFSNMIHNFFEGNQLKLSGYNYDQLYDYALRVKDSLQTYRRVSEVIINPEYINFRDDYSEFSTAIDLRRMTEKQFTPQQLFTSFRPLFIRNNIIGNVTTNDGEERIRMTAAQSKQYDVWNMMNIPVANHENQIKMNHIAELRRTKTPQKIVKEKQQYLLCVQFGYNGSGNQLGQISKRMVKEFSDILPMGYTIESPKHNRWEPEEKQQYLLILLIVTIIWFITGILFNHTKQPLAVIFVIPVAYIGVFYTFYAFNLRFDEGGFSSFVLLCGITVNSCIYILNDFNHLRRQHPNYSPLRAYLKAWNIKVVPVLLTIISTILGFIPFLVGEQKEAFWFPLAAGTIGGLIFSLIGIIVYLPIFCLDKGKTTEER